MRVEVFAKLHHGEAQRLQVALQRTAQLATVLLSAQRKVQPRKQGTAHGPDRRCIDGRIIPLERDKGICQRRAGRKHAAGSILLFRALRLRRFLRGLLPRLAERRFDHGLRSEFQI